jgi:hypothetical protein
MRLSWTTLIAASIAPVFISWALAAANRSSVRGKVFRPIPIVRGLYPVGIVLFGWCVVFFVSELFTPSEVYRDEPGWILLGLALAVFFLLSTAITWPITAIIEDEGLILRRMFRRRVIIPWTTIEDAAISLDGRLIIYASDSQFEVGAFNEGRYQLRDSVKAKVQRVSREKLGSPKV